MKRKVMKHLRCFRLLLLAGATLFAGSALAQEFPSYQGNNQRTGRHDADPRANNPDRAFLRWWDPLFQLTTTVDNWQVGNVTPTPPADWVAPPDSIFGNPFVELDVNAVPANAPYLYATPTVSAALGNFWEPETPAQLRTFEWRFNGLQAGQEYALYVNIPLGPTDIDPTVNINTVFNTTYQVYRVDGVENLDNPGQPIYEKLAVGGGGLIPFGNEGKTSDRVYRVATGSTQIRITLLNVIPRDSQGDPFDNPAASYAVYADSAEIRAGQATAGAVIASPVVGNLKTGTGPFDWRVFTSRIDPFSVADGNVGKNYGFPTITSFTHNGAMVAPPDNTGRRNIVWSWPARRPFDLTTASLVTYTAERTDWLEGEGRYPGPRRFDQSQIFDNVNGNVVPTSGWTVETVNPNPHGDNYLETPSGASITERVTYAPYLEQLEEGQAYFIDVYIPPGGPWANDVVYQIVSGATTYVARINQGNVGGWQRLRTGILNAFPSIGTQGLVVHVTNQGTGGPVVADAVRFTRVADVANTATSTFATVGIRQPGGAVVQRDVVFVPLENGRIYCMDARGTVGGTGTPTGDTTVYWSYPSEMSPDPNHAVGLDGVDGMAEMPSGFGLTSPAVARVQVSPGVFEDRLYIGSENGRVYCIDVAGRGDYAAGRAGSTTRVWTYPNDYPSPSVESRLGPIVGSVSFANTGAGPTLFVPTVQGRLYALNAVGDNINKTTNITWAFPGIADPPAGPMSMTPVVEFGNVYIGTGAGGFVANSTFLAINTDDTNSDQVGEVVWSRTDAGGLVFEPFRNVSPVTIPAANLNGTNDSVVLANDNFEVASLDANTGAVQWRTDELSATAASSLGFTYLRVAAGGVVGPPPGDPMVMVPQTNGSYTALFADTARLNRFGRRAGWTVTTRGQGFVPSMAFGGKDPTAPGLTDDENCWMYGGDAQGFTYAWNFDPDFPDNGQVITPGEPPIPPEPDIVDDNTAENLDTIVRNARVSFLIPSVYEDLARRLRSGTLTYADLQAASLQVTRQNYEYGETLHVMVWHLPDPNNFTPAFRYGVQGQLNARGVSTQVRTYGVSRLSGGAPDDRNQVVFFQWSLPAIGSNTVVPGRISMDIRVISQDRPGANRTVDPRDATRVLPQINRLYVANPLALSVSNAATGALNDPNSIGFTLNPNREDTRGNGNGFYDYAANGDISKLAQPDKVVLKGFSPDRNTPPDFVSHGQTAVADVRVYDRTLLTLIYGPDRGLQSVRIDLQNLFVQGVGFKLLDPTNYPDLEDQPGSIGNNTSLDYPDIRRDRFKVTKEQNRQVQNPLFEGVSLIPPTYTQAQFDTYRTDVAQYNQFFDRSLLPTNFAFALDVPKYQPPVNGGYRSAQTVYVDANVPGRQFSAGLASEAFRDLTMAAVVALDERISVGTPSLDLGAVPSGAGFSPLAPWNPASNFQLDSPLFHNASRFPFFSRMTVFNEGNVNLLNLRTAKQVRNVGAGATLPFVFQGLPNISAQAQLDMRWHLHSDLDLQFTGFMPNSQVILQKPRPGDIQPTRLRINPKRRANPNLEVVDGDLISSATLGARYAESIRDPKIGVSTPIGAPSGNYSGKVYVLEDRQTTQPPTINEDGTTGVLEPFNENDMLLSFTVRETRLTNRQTNKSAPMVDNLGLTGTERYLWSNQQPTAARTGDGTLVVAFSSDRLLNSNAPGFNSRLKTDGDMRRAPQSRLYFASLGLGRVTPTGDYSPMSDLSQFSPSNNARWFDQAVGAYPSQPLSVVFNLPASEIDPDSALFRDPAFPSAGVYDVLGFGEGTGAGDRGNMVMAFVGEVSRLTGGAATVREQRLFAARVETGSRNITVGDPVALQLPSGEVYNPTAIYGKPSVVQRGNRATVFYSLGTGSSGQIMWSHFNGGAWQQLGGGFRGGMANALDTGTAFESVSSPSAIALGNTMQLAFTGRLRGRSQSEMFMAQLRHGGNLIPQGGGGGFAQSFGLRFDKLVQEPSNSIYWSKGAGWVRNMTGTNGANITNPFAASFVDVFRLVVNGANVEYQSIIDHSTRQNVEGSPVYTYETIFGGKAYIDTESGAVRFSGAAIPRSAELYARYAPRFLRMSTKVGFNYRNVSMVYDDRPADDPSYWSLSNNTGATVGGSNDRYILGFVRTSSLPNSAARPSLSSFRFGVQLPTPIRTESNGNVTLVQVTGSSTSYQIEPSTGKLYFSAPMNGQNITVRYRAVDTTGRDLGVFQIDAIVGLIQEFGETELALSESASETSFSLMLDAIRATGNVNSNNRRPNLIWMFWNSSRGGGSDVYFQTIAPKWSSVLAGQ